MLAQQHLQRAYLLLDYGELDEALAACERAADVAPDHPMPHALAGSFLTSFGRPRDALKPLRRALRLAPDNPFALLTFAETNLALGRTAAANRALSKVAPNDDCTAAWLESLETLADTLEGAEPTRIEAA